MEGYTSLEEFNNATRNVNTYSVVSAIAYLIGIPKRIFENEHEPPKPEVYEKLEKNKNARIVRNLCIIRTAIMRNFKNINKKMQAEIKTYMSMPEYVPAEAVNQLTFDGVPFYKSSCKKLNEHIVELNRLISDRVNNCKDVLPLWLNWDYVHDLFIMPNGLTPNGTKEAAEVFYGNINSYPYQVYINWKPKENGNILFCDNKFVRVLYEMHHDEFEDKSMVSDVSDVVKDGIYTFINESEQIIIAVDCENSDASNLCTALTSLSSNTSKIRKIILFNDVHTSTMWEIFSKHTNIPVEHLLIDRVKADKSIIDQTLTAKVCQERYKNDIDSFIIVSSDSDYWALVSTLNDARFCFMVEHHKCSPAFMEGLLSRGIFFCYIDDFYTGDAEELRISSLFSEMTTYISNAVRLNVNDMLNDALWNTRISMSDAERKQFYAKYIKTLQMEIKDNGDVAITFKYRE